MEAVNRFFKLDKTTYEWQELPSMGQARCLFTLAHFDGHIYAIGGKNQDEYLDSAERFNLSTQRWDRAYELPEPMVDTRAAVVDDHLLIYGLSAYDIGQKATYAYAMVVFDRFTQEWTKILEEERDEVEDMMRIGSTGVFVRDGKCYRVYNPDSSACAHINEVAVTRQGNGTVTAAIGNSISNDVVKNSVNAFTMDGSLYINLGGTVHEYPQHRVCGDALIKHLNSLEPIFAPEISMVSFTMDLSKI